jgi:serine/threonine protein kinase
VAQVMRHERASVKADIWSYGILIWELVTGRDITEYAPLALSRQGGGAAQRQSGKLMALPRDCPAVAVKVFGECTRMAAEERPTSQDIVEWLRES